MRTRIILILAIIAVITYGCKSFSKNARVVGAPGTKVSPSIQDYRINPGDRLGIKLFYNPDMNQEVTVRPDGKISLMLVKEIQAAGMTPSDLNNLLEERYAEHLKQPDVVVIVNSFPGQRFFVDGEVGKPGAQELFAPITVLQAIANAGGFKNTARRDEVVILRRDENNKPFVMKLDAEDAMRGKDIEQDVYVKAYDIVLVPRSGIADVNLWVSQYIRGTVGAGADFLLYYNAISGGGF